MPNKKLLVEFSIINVSRQIYTFCLSLCHELVFKNNLIKNSSQSLL